MLFSFLRNLLLAAGFGIKWTYELLWVKCKNECVKYFCSCTESLSITQQDSIGWGLWRLQEQRFSNQLLYPPLK